MDPNDFNTTRFLNLDLDLESTTDLSPLVDYLGERVIVLCNEPVGDHFRLCLEPGGDLSHDFDPSECIDHFATLLNTLPLEIRSLWDSCESKVFDFGFESGLEPFHFSSSLPVSAVRSISSLGGEIKITIYAHQERPNLSLNPDAAATIN